MKLQQLDRFAGYSPEFGPLGMALQFLATCLRSPAATWSPGQREAAQQALNDAREVMTTDVVTLAGRAPVAPPQLACGHAAPPRDRAEVLQAIDRAEAETAAAIRAQEALDALMHRCRHDGHALAYADLVKLREAMA